MNWKIMKTVIHILFIHVFEQHQKSKSFTCSREQSSFFYFGRFGLPSKRTQKKTIENASRQRRLKTPLKWRFLKTANLRIENGGLFSTVCSSIQAEVLENRMTLNVCTTKANKNEFRKK